MTSSVYTLTDTTPVREHIQLLEKGFIPTTERWDQDKWNEDIEQFIRKLKTRWYFRNRPSSRSRKSLAEALGRTKTKKWSPPNNSLDDEEKITLQAIQKQLKDTRPKQTRSNLTAQERKSLRELKKDNNIIIKPADKGSGTVIWQKDKYIKEAERQLAHKCYRKMESDPLTETSELLERTLNNLKAMNSITDQDHKAMLQTDARLASFYMLPKIHKSLTNPPGRPIMSGNGHPTEWISAWLDKKLQPIVQSLPTYLKDTTHLLQMLKTIHITPNTRIISLDVTSLYTNIPQEAGIKSLGLVGKQLHPSGNYNTIEFLARKVLENNVFEFNGTYYRQIEGTAMGTRMAPAYANIYMYTIEKAILSTSPEIIFWKRFIDDVICVFEETSPNTQQQLIDKANNITPEIQFTTEGNTEQGTNFLDTNIKIVNGSIRVAPYIKPTDKRLYVRHDSNHPSHQKNNIAYSQALRLRRICSEEEDYTTHTNLLKEAMIKRGYEENKIQPKIDLCKKMNRDTLLDTTQPPQTQEKETDTIFFSTTYHPGLPDIKQIVMKHIKNVDPELRVIVSQRRNKNLGDILVRASIQEPPRREPPTQMRIKENKENENSNSTICVLCHPFNSRDYVDMGDENKFKGRPRKIRSCKQMHNKYLIVCDICKDMETINLLTTPHNLIAAFRNKDLNLNQHPHERDCLNITIYPVWTTYKLTVRCTDCRIINTATIQRMPETVKYEIETAVYSLWKCSKNITEITKTDNCDLCSKNRYTTITTNWNKRIYTNTFKCKETNVIYSIQCMICGGIYVGQTSQPLKTRIRQHQRDIRLKSPTSSVAKHFNIHDQDPDMLIFILDTETDKFKRLVKEMCWIEIMHTSDPKKGMNIDCMYHYDLLPITKNTYTHYQHSTTCRPLVTWAQQ